MPSRSRFSCAVFSPRLAAVLLGSVLLSGQAMASVEVSTQSALSSDSLVVTHYEGRDVHTLRSSGYSVNDIRKMQEALETLQRSHKDQARQLEELKRNTGSKSSSSDSEVTALKRTVSDQQSDIASLRKQVEELKRSAGSSSSSSSSEVSSLKREVSDQNRELQSLKRSLEELNRKVK